MNYREAVYQFCMACKRQDAWAVGNCEILTCALYPVRPNQRLQGQRKEDLDMEVIEQDVVDQLNFTGLKTILRKD